MLIRYIISDFVAIVMKAFFAEAHMVKQLKEENETLMTRREAFYGNEYFMGEPGGAFI